MCKRGDIYYADLGSDFSSSIQNGTRPVLVVSNDLANAHSPVVTIVPLTAKVQKKTGLPTHVDIPTWCGSGLPRSSVALAEQVRTIAKDQLRDHRGHIPNGKVMAAVTKALQIQIGAIDTHH